MRDPLGAFLPDDGLAPRQDSTVGPLAGLTFAVKDLFAVAGARVGFGNPDWVRTHPPAETDAPLVAACLEAGATLLGRTVLDECAYSLSGRNPHYGTPTNPNAPGRVAGGSSCGSAAAVAGGLVDFALGTDTGGSVRVPASYCGLYGLRPTHGALSLAGAVPLAPSFDTAGWFARDAAVMRAVGQALLPPAPADVPLEPSGVVVAEDAWACASPEAQDALRPWLTRLAQRYGPVESMRLAEETEGGLAAWSRDFRFIQAAEARRAHGDWVARTRPAFGPEMAERWAFVESVTEAQAAAAARAREGYRHRLRRLCADGKVLCLPAAPEIAPPVAADAAVLRTHRERVMALTCPAGLAGLPQVTLPVARLSGLPLGLGLVGPAGSDRLLLEVAAALDPEAGFDPGARFDPV